MTIASLIGRVHHTAICVQDFEAMRDFLVDFIGFELEGEMDHRAEPALGVVVGLPGAEIRWAMLRCGSHRVELFKYYKPEGANRHQKQCDTGITHLAFEVEDVDAVNEAVLLAGFKPLSSPQLLRGGATKVIYLAGPEEITFEFIEFPAKRGGA